MIYDKTGISPTLTPAKRGGKAGLTNSDAPVYAGYTNIRRLTPTECERLQGFPDGWTEGVSDTQRYKCLGNAVTTNVVSFIGTQMINPGQP